MNTIRSRETANIAILTLVLIISPEYIERMSNLFLSMFGVATGKLSQDRCKPNLTFIK